MSELILIGAVALIAIVAIGPIIIIKLFDLI